MLSPAITHLTEAYRRISEERMRGLPLFNERLTVEAVGFTEWEGHLLGVLITPWFMNLVLLGGDQDDWSKLINGTSTSWSLPSGEYEFIVNTTTAAEVHQSCTLFTTVSDFPDQETARLVAQTIMANVIAIRAPNTQEVTPQSTVNDVSVKILSKPVSRRELLRSFIPGEK